jgi:hypothetical protein
MSRVRKPDEAYAGRRFDAVVINATIDVQAATILHHYCPPGRKGTGKFLSRLLYEHDAREQERVRLRVHIQEVLREGKAL